MSCPTDIPNDIVSRICSFLEPNYQLTASHVCSQWRDALQTSLEANYKFARALHHFYPTLNYTEDLAERRTQFSRVFLNNKTIVESNGMSSSMKDPPLPPFTAIPCTMFTFDDSSRVLIGATVPAIIDHLILEIRTVKRSGGIVENDNFMQMFLQTYESLDGLTYQNFLFLLMDQFTIAETEFVNEKLDTEESLQLQKKMLGLLDLLQCWLTHTIKHHCALYHKYASTEELKQTIRYMLHFIDAKCQIYVSDKFQNHQMLMYFKGVQVKHALQSSLRKAEKLKAKMQFKQAERSDDDPIFDVQNLFDLPLNILADQLTIYQYEISRSVRSYEYCGVKWRKQKTGCPHVITMLDKFVRLSEWAALQIVLKETPEERVELMRKFVYLCKHLEARRNFQTLFAIVGGITSASVYRLHRTKELMSAKEMATFEDLRELVSLRGNFMRLRAQLDSCTSLPSIPYTGFFLADLKSIYDTQMSIFTEECQRLHSKGVYLVNLYHLKKEYDIIHQVNKWMHEVTYYEEDIVQYDHIQELIRRTIEESSLLSQEDLFRLSLRREPRTT